MHRLPLLGLIAAAALAAACGGGYGSSTAPSASSAPAGHALIGTTRASIGTVLAGPNGHAIYVLVNQRQMPVPCTGGCLIVWPPVTATAGAPVAGSSVTAALSTTGSGGSMQVTVGGDPAYYYASDTAAGQTNGEGISSFGGTWYVLQPSGQLLKPGGGGGGSSSASAATSNGY